MLKTGQKVTGDDLYPLAEWSEVVAKDFWVLVEGLGKVVDVFLGTRRGVECHCKRLLSHCFEVFLVRKTIGFVPFLEGVVPCGKQPRQRPRVLPLPSHELLGLWEDFLSPIILIFYSPFLEVSRIFTIFVPNYKKAKYNSAMIKDFGYCQQMSVFRL